MGKWNIPMIAMKDKRNLAFFFILASIFTASIGGANNPRIDPTTRNASPTPAIGTTGMVSSAEYDAKGKPIRFTGGADPRGEGAAIGLNTTSGVEKAAFKK
jgi:hypothetical protein